MIVEADKKRLAELLWRTPGCVARGKFTLRSGKESDLYVDCRKLLTTSPGLKLVVEMLSTLIRDKCPSVSVVGAPGMGGALLIGGFLMQEACMPAIFPLALPMAAFVVRDKPKDHGALDNLIVGSLPGGSWVVLVDDVFTSGGSLRQSAEAVAARNAKVVGAFVIVDREEEGQVTDSIAGFPCYRLLSRTELLRWSV